METTEGSKLITEFTGHKIVAHLAGSNDPIYDIETDACKGYSLTGMKYHNDWNWIMPVTREVYDRISPVAGDTQTEVIGELTIALLEEDVIDVFRAVVEAIKWYNENKKS